MSKTKSPLELTGLEAGFGFYPWIVSTGSYTSIFVVAASAYLVALLVMYLPAPRLELVAIDRQEAD